MLTLLLASDCSEVMTIEGSHYKEGVKTIYIKGQPTKVYCDNDGYTAIQSRG